MSSLKTSLLSLANLQAISGAKSTSKSITVLADALANYDFEIGGSQNIEDALSSLDKVKYFLGKLGLAAGDQDQFDQTIKEFAKAGVLSKKEMDQLAFQYAGGRKTYKSKNLALAAIRNKFARDVLFESKREAS